MNAELIPLSKGWVREHVEPPPPAAWVDSLRWAEAAVAKVARPEIPAGAPVEAIRPLGVRPMAWRDLRDVRFPPPEWLVKGFLERKKMAAIIGAPKSAKTWLGDEVAISVATGLPMCGYPDMDAQGRPSPVFVWCVEDHAPDVQRRIKSLWAGRDSVMPHDDENLGNNLHILAGQRIDLMSREQFLQALATIRVTVEAPALVVMDPFVDLVEFENENDARQMATAVERFRIIRDVFGCAVLLVHHAKKSKGGKESDVNSARGSNAFMGKLDSWALMDGVEAADDGSSIGADLRVTLKNGRRVPGLHVELRIEDSAEGYARTATWVLERKVSGAARQEATGALEDRILEHLGRNGLCAADAVAKAIGGASRDRVREALHALESQGRVVNVNEGRSRRGYALPDAQF